MSDTWPAVRTQMSEHHGYEMGHAASIGLVAVLIGLPLIGLGLSWLLDAQSAEVSARLTIHSVSQMIAYSPLVSWIGLIIGIPPVYAAIRRGYGGWLVTMAIGGCVGAVVLLTAVWYTIEIAGVNTGLRVGMIGAGFGALFAGVYWLAMRLTAPALFRAPGQGWRAAQR